MAKLGNPNWAKGKSGNLNGRPRDPIVAEMREALREVEKRKRKKLLVRFFERAFVNDKVLIAAVKKIVPDLQHTTGGLDSETIKSLADFLNNGKNENDE